MYQRRDQHYLCDVGIHYDIHECHVVRIMIITSHYFPLMYRAEMQLRKIFLHFIQNFKKGLLLLVLFPQRNHTDAYFFHGSILIDPPAWGRRRVLSDPYRLKTPTTLLGNAELGQISPFSNFLNSNTIGNLFSNMIKIIVFFL